MFVGEALLFSPEWAKIDAMNWYYNPLSNVMASDEEEEYSQEED